MDKNEGYDDVLESLNLGITVKLCADPNASLDNCLADKRVPLIWTVDITDTGGTTPERELEMRYEQYEKEKDETIRKGIADAKTDVNINACCLACVPLCCMVPAFVEGFLSLVGPRRK